jgi:hypothetical protein
MMKTGFARPDAERGREISEKVKDWKNNPAVAGLIACVAGHLRNSPDHVFQHLRNAPGPNP